MDATNVTNQWIASIIRYLLVGIGTFLTHKGIVDNSLWEMTVPVIILGATAAFWSLYQKFKVKEAVETALGMPQGSNSADLKARLQK